MKEFKFNNNIETERYLKYIIELGNEVGIEEQKIIKKKSNNNISYYLYYCKDTLFNLEQKEISINRYIKEIEKIIKNKENDKSLIEKLILDRKKIIKKEKQLMIKKQQEEQEQIKKLRAIERAKRIVIKGRKVFPDIPPSKKILKSIETGEYNIKDDNNYQYLYYSDDE